MKTGVLDFTRSGNIYSVVKAVQELGHDVEPVNDPSGVDRLIIPGVGSYASVSEEILPYRDAISDFVKSRPILGICLGMQLLCRVGFEFGEHDGLGLIEGECVKLNTPASLPHLGWGNLQMLRPSRIIDESLSTEAFYFMHSFGVVNYADSTALTTYGGHQFVSAVEKDNVFGVQFHPEKSGKAGLQLLDNFITKS